jgi:hypothetical protein
MTSSFLPFDPSAHTIFSLNDIAGKKGHYFFGSGEFPDPAGQREQVEKFEAELKTRGTRNSVSLALKTER